MTPPVEAPPEAATAAAPPSSPSAGESAGAAVGAVRGAEAPLADAASFQERALPTQVSAAWELELLIAGAVTFALVQLPGQLEAMGDWLQTVVGGTRTGRLIANLSVIYAKAALYTLIIAFITNLVARAYWVGLVGLHSVYPHGPRWERLRMGPIFTETYRRQIPSLPAVIARVDNFASVIFSFAFLVVVLVVFSVAGLALFASVAWAIAQLLTGGRFVLPIAMALGALLLAPSTIASLVDKRRGDRVDPALRARIERLARVSSHFNGAVLFGPIMFTLMSNAGRNRVLALAYVALFGALSVSMGERSMREGVLDVGRPDFAPADTDVRGLHAAHYESMARPRVGERVVTIQSEVVTGPYVRLFIPFQEERHARALRGCAATRAGGQARPPADTAEARADGVLACLAALHAVTLDGVRIANPGFRFHEHPTTGVAGMVAYLPTAGLAPGVHTLVVQPPPPTPGRERRPNSPAVIPFWR